MDTNTAIIAFTALVIGGTIVVTIINTIGRSVARRGSRGGETTDLLMTRIEERLDRMEQAIDAVAVEVERVSEGQRFTTKLLSEKKPDALVEHRG